jgi:HK97 gp10 family phage protein
MTTIVGEKALIKRLESFAKDSSRNRVARPAVREASGEIRKKMKALAPVDFGLLKKSIKNVMRTGKVGPYAVIGPAHGFKQVVRMDGRNVASDPTKYAHLVEFGTQAHIIRPENAKALTIDANLASNAVHPGSRPRPFMRPAYDSVPAFEIMRKRMAQELPKEVMRLNARGRVA